MTSSRNQFVHAGHSHGWTLVLDDLHQQRWERPVPVPANHVYARMAAVDGANYRPREAIHVGYTATGTVSSAYWMGVGQLGVLDDVFHDVDESATGVGKRAQALAWFARPVDYCLTWTARNASGIDLPLGINNER